MTISSGNELLDPMPILEKAGVEVGTVVADLGCGGIGHFILPAGQKVGNGGIAYAVDVQKSVLASVAARARLEGINNIKTVWSDLEIPNATKIPAESLDVAMLINVLFQSGRREAMITEGLRLLKNGGNLLVIDWLPQGGSFGPPAQARTDPDEIKAIAGKHGLAVVEGFAAGTYHFGILFKKN